MQAKNMIWLFITGMICCTCNDPNSPKQLTTLDTATIDDKAVSDSLNEETAADTLYKLLEKAITSDTFTSSHETPFWFIKTGRFLSGIRKNAILVSCPTDSTYRVELYVKSADDWIRNDEIVLPDAFPLQFNLRFEDYNFDGQADIYLQTSVSNGYALSRGYLLTIEPNTQKLRIHTETRKLANMHPDAKSKTVLSEEVIWSEEKGFQDVCDVANKWINGQLIKVKRICPSRNPQGY